MTLAENKYKSCLLSIEWGNPSDKEVEIVALTAKIDVSKEELSRNKKMKTKRTRKKALLEKIQNGAGKRRNQQKIKVPRR